MEVHKEFPGGVVLRSWETLFSLQAPEGRCYPYRPVWWGSDAAAVGRSAALGDMPAYVLADWIEDHPGFHLPHEVTMLANFLREWCLTDQPTGETSEHHRDEIARVPVLPQDRTGSPIPNGEP